MYLMCVFIWKMYRKWVLGGQPEAPTHAINGRCAVENLHFRHARALILLPLVSYVAITPSLYPSASCLVYSV